MVLSSRIVLVLTVVVSQVDLGIGRVAVTSPRNQLNFKRMNIMRIVTKEGGVDTFSENTFSEDNEKQMVNSKKNGACVDVRINANKMGEYDPIRSPNWPKSYPINQDCSYFITSPPGTQITIACDINIACNKPNDYIFWSLSGDRNFGDAQGYCGHGRLDKATSNSNSLALGFHSEDDPRPRSRLPYRWRCHFRVVTAPTSATTTSSPTTTRRSIFTTTPRGTIIPPDDDTCTCGRNNPNGLARIVGGFETRRHEIPWRVLVFIYDRKTRSGGLCGGTLISNSWVMTAAHCTRRYQRGYGISVYTEAQANPVTIGGGIENIVDRFIEHPRFSTDNFDNDVALLHLSKPVEYSDKVSPACLPYGPLSISDYSGFDVTASGWGTLDPVPANGQHPGGEAAVSDTLMKVTLPVLTTSQCSLYQAVTDNQFCTYKPGKDTCQGDSGGSVDYQFKGLFYSIGIVSFGAGCAQAEHPGAYTKVNNYLAWIEQASGEKFCQPK